MKSSLEWTQTTWGGQYSSESMHWFDTLTKKLKLVEKKIGTGVSLTTRRKESHWMSVSF